MALRSSRSGFDVPSGRRTQPILGKLGNFTAGLCYVTCCTLAKGQSGRIVVELEPDLKRHLYGVLAREGLTLKDWFVAAAKRHIQDYEQPALLRTLPTPGDSDA